MLGSGFDQQIGEFLHHGTESTRVGPSSDGEELGSCCRLGKMHCSNWRQEDLRGKESRGSRLQGWLGGHPFNGSDQGQLQQWPQSPFFHLILTHSPTRRVEHFLPMRVFSSQWALQGKSLGFRLVAGFHTCLCSGGTVKLPGCFTELTSSPWSSPAGLSAGSLKNERHARS